MTQDTVGMALICSHPCYLMSHQLIKQVCGTVGNPTLRYKAREGHALQYFHQEIILHQSTLA